MRNKWRIWSAAALAFVALSLSQPRLLSAQAEPSSPSPAPTEAPPEKALDELLREAANLLQQEDFSAAVPLLEAYLEHDPQDFRARFNLALSYSMTGRRASAIEQYRLVLQQGPDLLPAHLNLGILLLEEGLTGEALQHFDKVSDAQPDHWAAHVNRAAALVALNRLDDARQAYRRALELKPDDALTHLALAKILPTSDLAAAEEHLRRSLQLDSSLDEAQLLLAGVLEARAAQEPARTEELAAEAAQLYHQLLQAHPSDLDLRLSLANLFASQGRMADSVRELEAARSSGGATLALNSALLQAYLQAGESDKALLLLPELLAQNSSDAELHLLLGSLRMEKRQYPEAAEAFRRATELQPGSPEGFRNLASALYLMQNYAATVEALAPLAQRGQDTAGSYFLRAITLDKLNDKAAALENYRQFLSVDEQRNPDQEFQARQRVRVLEREVRR